MSFNHDEDGSNHSTTSVSIFKLVRWPAFLVLGMFVLQVIVQPFFVLEVPAGYAAALATGGSVHDGYYMPGPHLKSPIEHPIFMKLWTVSEPRETTPTDSNNQPIGATVVPQIWIDPAAVPELAQNYGDFDTLMKNVVDPQINQATRAQTSLRTPEQLIWDRPAVVQDIQKALQSAITAQLAAKGLTHKDAIHVGLVAVTQFGFSKPVRDTLEAKAESQVKTHTATAQAKIRFTNAEKDGRVTEILADGEATSAQIISAANAYKVQKVGEANAAAPDVAKYEAIMNWLRAGGHSSRVQLGANTQVIISGISDAPVVVAPTAQQ